MTLRLARLVVTGPEGSSNPRSWEKAEDEQLCISACRRTACVPLIRGHDGVEPQARYPRPVTSIGYSHFIQL